MTEGRVVNFLEKKYRAIAKDAFFSPRVTTHQIATWRRLIFSVAAVHPAKVSQALLMHHETAQKLNAVKVRRMLQALRMEDQRGRKKISHSSLVGHLVVIFFWSMMKTSLEAEKVRTNKHE